jgi:MFS family permease
MSLFYASSDKGLQIAHNRCCICNINYAGDDALLAKMKEKTGLSDQQARNTRLFTLEGAICAVILNLANPFFSMFAKRLGAGDYEIGLLSSLPALIGIFALIPGALLVDRQRDKKGIVALLILLFGIMYPLAAVTPYLGGIRVYVFILLIALMNWPFSVFNISWQSFFSDVLSGNSRSTAYAKRSSSSTLFGITTGLLAGIILAYIPRTDAQRIFIYQIFFTVSFALALLQRWYLSKIDGYTLREALPLTGNYLTALKTSLRGLAANRQFRFFTLISFVFHAAWQMAWPLFFIFQVDHLHANEAWLSYINVASGITGVATFAFWGRVINRKGAKWVVIIGALGLSINPIIIVNLKTLFWVLLANTLVGLTFSAFQLALFENLLEVVPQENKTLNFAIYTTFISISSFFAPMIGVWIYTMTDIHFAMTLAGILRLSATGLFVLRYVKSIKEQPKSLSL